MSTTRNLWSTLFPASIGRLRRSSRSPGARWTQSRSTLFLFLLWHDRTARITHDYRHGLAVLATSAGAKGRFHTCLFCTGRSRGLVLALRRYCVDFSFSLALSHWRAVLMSQHIEPLKTYVTVFVSLISLTLLTTAVAFIDLGPFNTVVALAIAFCKMMLVILFFMHVRHSGGLVRITIIAGFFWLALLIGLTMADYQTRTWTPPPQAWSKTAPPTHP